MSNADAELEIMGVMAMQEKAWSDGDVHQFMEGYWKSENLSFVGKSGINKGWQTTLDNYIKGYPTKDAMGKLTFDVLELNISLSLKLIDIVAFLRFLILKYYT